MAGSSAWRPPCSARRGCGWIFDGGFLPQGVCEVIREFQVASNISSPDLFSCFLFILLPVLCCVPALTGKAFSLQVLHWFFLFVFLYFFVFTFFSFFFFLSHPFLPFTQHKHTQDCGFLLFSFFVCTSHMFFRRK